MKYNDTVTLKIILSGLVTLIGIPAYFYYGGDPIFAAVVIFLGWIANNLAQIGYHRWLSHSHFEPHFFCKWLMLFSMVSSGIGPPGHQVVAHLNHHAKSDTPDDTHSPKHLGFWGVYLARYNTPKHINPMQMRHFLRKKDVVLVSKYYFNLQILLLILYTLVTPWLLVFAGLQFFHGFLGYSTQIYFAHSGTKGEPTDIHPVVNFLLLGEGTHRLHHERPSEAVFGPGDWSGRFIVPLLKNK